MFRSMTRAACEPELFSGVTQTHAAVVRSLGRAANHPILVKMSRTLQALPIYSCAGVDESQIESAQVASIGYGCVAESWRDFLKLTVTASCCRHGTMLICSTSITDILCRYGRGQTQVSCKTPGHPEVNTALIVVLQVRWIGSSTRSMHGDVAEKRWRL